MQGKNLQGRNYKSAEEKNPTGQVNLWGKQKLLNCNWSLLMCKAPGRKESDVVSDSRAIWGLYSCVVTHSDKFLVLSDATTV